MQFFVLRHASHDFELGHYRYLDYGLSAIGRECLRMVQPQIQEQEIQNFLVSISPRSQETAVALRQMGLFDSFISLRSFNPLRLPEGENWQRFQEAKNKSGKSWAELWLASYWAGLEAPADFLLRLERALLEHKARFQKKTLLLAHEETIWGLNVLLNGKTWREAIKEPVPPGSFHIFEMETV